MGVISCCTYYMPQCNTHKFTTHYLHSVLHLLYKAPTCVGRTSKPSSDSYKFGRIIFHNNDMGAPIMECGRDGKNSLSAPLDRNIYASTSKL